MKKFSPLLLASALLALALSVKAEPPLWKNVALGGGGAIIGMCADPNVEGLFYMRADIGGAYRWNPTDSRWIPITEKLPGGNSNDFGCDSLAVDPSNGKTVYIMTGKYAYGKGAHIYKSTDAGETWTSLPTPPGLQSNSNAGGRKCGERIGIDPNNPQVLAVASRTVGFWMSTDGGATWKQKGTFAPAAGKPKGSGGMSFVTFDKSSGQKGTPTPVLYVGVSDSDEAGGVWKSKDGGETWAQMANGLHSPARGAVTNDGTFYVTFAGNKEVKGAVLKAERSAASLTDCTPEVEKPERQSFGGLALDPTNPKILCVSETPGVFELDTFRSTDAGATWIKAGRKHGAGNAVTRDSSQWFGNISQIVINPFNSKEVWMADWLGALRTPDITDPNKAWDYLSAGDEEVVPLCLICPPSGALLISGCADINGAAHFDLMVPPENSFCKSSKPTSIGSTTALDFCEADPTRWVRVMGSFIGSPNGNFSNDGGKTWRPFANVPKGARHGRVAMSATDPNVIVWQPEDGKLYATKDGGKTWTESTTAPKVGVGEFNQDAQPLTSDRVNGSTFYLVRNVADQGTTQLWRSVDGGVTWAVAATIAHPEKKGVFQYKLIAAPGIEGYLWLDLGYVGIYKSTNGGSTFAPIPGIGSAGMIAFGKPAPSHKNPAVFLLGNAKNAGGIFRSDDDGATWVQIGNPQTPIGDQPRVMGADRQVYGRVYIGTDGRGIYFNDVPGPTSASPAAVPPAGAAPQAPPAVHS